MFRVTLPFYGMTWEDLRRYVELNANQPDDEIVGLETDEDFQPVGLSETVSLRGVSTDG